MNTVGVDTVLLTGFPASYLRSIIHVPMKKQLNTQLFLIVLALVFWAAAGPALAQQGGVTAPAESGSVYLPMVAGGAGTGGGGDYFATLPVGSALPSGSNCAARVKARPENKGDNQIYNATEGNQALPPDMFPSSDDPRANTQIGVRVDGEFTGTTDEILQWAACKWGMDEDMVRAQAAIESWWHQDAMGDWTSDSSRCAPGPGIGVDGRPGQCPESFGILQNRYP